MPKQLVQLGLETLLERTVRLALEAGLHPVFGVIPLHLSIDPVPVGMVPVINEEAAEGMASSIRIGLRSLAGYGTPVAGAILLACDQPRVTAQHLRELAKGAGDIFASAYSGRKGIPAYFPRTAFEALLALHGDIGARDLLRNAQAIDLPGGEIDIDTMQDLEQARKMYETDA